MEIQAKLLSIRAFSELLTIAEQSQVEISFLGTKYICVNGHEGTLHIDALAARTLELLKQINYEFTEAEREPGKRLAARIDRLYKDSGSKLLQAACFTKLSGMLRILFDAASNYIFGVESIRVQWQGEFFEPNKDFEYYTRTQFINRYGFTPEAASNHGYNFIDINHSPPRWKIPQSSRVIGTP